MLLQISLHKLCARQAKAGAVFGPTASNVMNIGKSWVMLLYGRCSNHE